MTPYWTSADGRHVIYHGRAEDVLPSVGKVDAFVLDPPYGIGADAGIGKYGRIRGYTERWDSETPDIQAVLTSDVSTIVWGGNYFNLPPSRCWLIWDKGAGFKGRDFAECEMAWCNFDGNARTFQYDPLARGDYRNKVHPTQKPVALMQWCLSFVPDAEVICDPYMGSGTTLVACEREGRRGIGIECEKKYCDIAIRRIEEAMQTLWRKPEPDVQLELK